MRALEYALSLAEQADARLILLHVVEAFTEHVHLGEITASAIREYHRYLEQDALKRLAAAVPEQARSSCKPEEQIASGKAYREILRVASDVNAELIVMGVHGRAAVTTRLLGSTTDHVIREATCPVLSLRA